MQFAYAARWRSSDFRLSLTPYSAPPPAPSTPPITAALPAPGPPSTIAPPAAPTAAPRTAPIAPSFTSSVVLLCGASRAACWLQVSMTAWEGRATGAATTAGVAAGVTRAVVVFGVSSLPDQLATPTPTMSAIVITRFSPMAVPFHGFQALLIIGIAVL